MSRCYHFIVMRGVDFPVDRIRPLCERNLVQRLELFGSTVTNRFDPNGSDFDFLVTFKPMCLDQRADTFFGLLFGLEDTLHRQIDLVDFEAIRNPIFRESVEQSPRKILCSVNHVPMLLDAVNTRLEQG